MASASLFSFQPLGATHLIEADAGVPAPVQINVYETTTGAGQYRIVNTSLTEIVFLGVGATPAQAIARAAAIVAGTPSDTIVLMPGQTEILRFANNAFFTGFATSAADVYITPGQGL